MIVIRSARLRTLCGTVPLALMLLLLLLPAEWLGRYYAPVSLLMVILSLLLFVSGFPAKQLGTRRLVLVSVMTALSVLGRMLPVIKPVTALTILTALYLGREAGFLTGAMSAVLSNFVMGQGPWTPFQMLAWGMIGYLAGVLAKPLRRSKWLLLCYGALSGVVFSCLMDVWTTVWTFGAFSAAAYAAALVTALPVTGLYAFSNLLFLLLLADPVGHKLARVQKKYGL